MIVIPLVGLVCAIPMAMAITRLPRAFREGGAKDRSGETYTRAEQPVQFWFIIGAYVLSFFLFGGFIVWFALMVLRGSITR